MPPRIVPLFENAIRVTHAPVGQPTPPDRPWLAHILQAPPPCAACGVLTQVNAHGQLTATYGGVRFAEVAPARFGRQAGHVRGGVSVDPTAFEIRREALTGPDAIQLTFDLQPGEGLYGFGEWFDRFRRERGRIKLKIRDAIALLQHRETYSGIPVYFSARGYGLWLLNSHPCEFILEPERGRLRVIAGGPNADYILFFGPSFKRLIETYTALSGRPSLPPKKMFGLMVTGYPQEHQDVVLARVREHRRRGLPLDSVILDYQWEQRYHNFEWRRELFPQPEAFIGALREQGIQVGLITTPFMNHRNRPLQRWFLQTMAGNRPKTVADADERAPEEYQTGLARGYFAHPNARWWFGAGGMLDFTNPEATAWWNRLAAKRYADGIAFFKNDDGEYLPLSATCRLGLDGREHHNLYGFFYTRAMAAGMTALDDRRPFVYFRSAWAGSQRFPGMFLGDQKPTFEHIARTLRAGLSMGLLGFAFWTADVFGLDGETTPETHRRYAQWALFSPIARFFWRPPDVDDTRLPWSHGADNEANFKTHAELRYRLLPYWYTLAREAHETGLPLLRPMLLEFQEDARMWHVDDQAMLGDRLLLAPVLSADARRRRVVLPHGRWYDFWSGAMYEGGRHTLLPVRPDQVPLLVRGGHLLPLGPALPYIDPGQPFDDVELHAYAPFPARCVLYDDDGATRRYLDGEHHRTLLDLSPGPDGLTLTVDRPAALPPLTVTLVLHGLTASGPLRLPLGPLTTGRRAITEYKHELSGP
jgi:alpha-glucosidase (family GH31 glycosyl hydrolase)